MNKSSYIALPIDLQHVVTTQQAWHYHIVPKAKQGSVLEFYVSEEKYNDQLTDELELLYGKTVHLEKAASPVIQATLGKYYRNSSTNASVRQITAGNVKADDFLP